MRFIDSNVFIYVLVRSPRDDYEFSKKILQRIENGEEAITNTAVIQEIVDWLEYNGRRGEVRKLLIALNSYISMRKAEVLWVDFMNALNDVEKYALDFVDALILQTMRRNGVKEIYSNDRDFDRVGWVRRVWR